MAKRITVGTTQSLPTQIWRITKDAVKTSEFYNLGMDEKTKKPTGSIQYDVVNKANNQTVLSQTEDLGSIPNASAFLVTVEKKLPLKTLPPGNYTLRLKMVDKLKNQTLTPSAAFTVTS